MYNAADAGTYANAQGIRPEDIKQTPHDRLLHLLEQATQAINAASGASTDPELVKAKGFVEQARTIIDGYDTYVTECSSPPPPVVEKMWKEGYEHDWGKTFVEGKTKIRLIPEMSAGPYEGVVLQQLAKLSNVCLWCMRHMFASNLFIRFHLGKKHP